MAQGNKNIPYSLYKYIFGCFLVTLAIRIILTRYYNSSYGGIEQNVIYGIQRLLLGQSLYQDPAAGAYAVVQYTPLYYQLIAAMARLAGTDGHDVQGIYVLCRSYALLCNLLTVFTAALIIRSWRYSWLCCFGFAMPVLLMLTTHYYTRGDSLHLLLFAAAIYAYILHSRRRGLRDILAAALLTAACIMTKQSGILAAGIIGCGLLCIERKVLTLLLYSLCTLGFAYIMADAALHDNWQAFYSNTYLGLKNGIDASFLYRIFTSQFFMDMVPCYVVGSIMVWLAVKNVTDKTFRIVAMGAGLSFLFAVVTGLKVGSSNNYFMEFLLFVLIALPYVLQHNAGAVRILGNKVTMGRFAYIALLVLVTSKTLGLVTAVYIEKSLKNRKPEYESEQALYGYMRQLGLRSGEHIFFTDRMFLDNLFFDNAIMPTKDVVSQTYAADSTTFDYRTFAAGMNTGLIKYIITTKNRPDINEWNRQIPFLQFDASKFRLLATYGSYTIYVFTPAS